MTKISAFLVFALAVPSIASAQTPAAASFDTGRLEIQTFTVSTRYQFIENSDRDVTANHVQFKDNVGLRLRLDKSGRVALHGALTSGGTFTGSWDNSGIGTGDAGGAQSVRQLFLSVTPARGIEIQGGGLPIARGLSTEITSYDEDGFVVGERLSVRMPRHIYFDEVSMTGAALGPVATPGVLRRFDRFAAPNYWQAQVVKVFGAGLSGSADLTRVSGIDTIRAAVMQRFTATPITSLRVELYRRSAGAAGFAVAAERNVSTRVRLLGGYGDIDRESGRLNGDRYQNGRRLFAVANVALRGPLSAQIYATQALRAADPFPNRTRLDIVLSYDFLKTLRRPSN